MKRRENLASHRLGVSSRSMGSWLTSPCSGIARGCPKNREPQLEREWEVFLFLFFSRRGIWAVNLCVFCRICSTWDIIFTQVWGQLFWALVVIPVTLIGSRRGRSVGQTIAPVAAAGVSVASGAHQLFLYYPDFPLLILIAC